MKVKVNSQSLSLKLDKLKEKANRKALDKVRRIGQDVVQVSPVDTGAFVESWSILPKGSGGGRSKSSKTPARRAVSGKLSEGQKQQLREKSKVALESDLAKFGEQILNLGGAVIRNRAPHQPYVERKYNILGAYVRDRNS
jgi:hypothetical protein